MTAEPQQVSGSELGLLQSCLVGGDPEQRDRERRLRRRALVISIATQSVAVAAMVLIPLFLKPERIALANVVPVPPYYSHPQPRPADPGRPRAPQRRDLSRLWAPTEVPQRIVTHTEDADPVDRGELQEIFDARVGSNRPGQIPLMDTRVPAEPQVPRVETPHTVHLTRLDPALLTRRVEPVYPVLMKQIGRSGQVQLHAIIGTDGAMQSLQVVTGDPGFYQSALEAVRQWRYRPTVLNGTPVEVDTFITVIYNIAR